VISYSQSYIFLYSHTCFTQLLAKSNRHGAVHCISPCMRLDLRSFKIDRVTPDDHLPRLDRFEPLSRVNTQYSAHIFFKPRNNRMKTARRQQPNQKPEQLRADLGCRNLE
jgi:hypothetical protein